MSKSMDTQATLTEAPPQEPGVVITNSGDVYCIGYAEDTYGVWDKAVRGTPVATFPRTDQGWRGAWARFSTLESNLASGTQQKDWVNVLVAAGLVILAASPVVATKNPLGFAPLLVICGLLYWFSDSIALTGSQGQPAAESRFPELHRIVRELAADAQIPVPRVFVSPDKQMNAFAAGRDPRNSIICVNQGLLDAATERELRAVLAHESAHIFHHDALLMTIAQGAAIWITATFDEDGNNPFFAQIAGFLLQMAVSRNREYHADEAGARLIRDPGALADFLEKMDAQAREVPALESINPAQAALFIVNPFSGRSLMDVFSTHPPTELRVRRLREMIPTLEVASGGRAEPADPAQNRGLSTETQVAGSPDVKICPDCAEEVKAAAKVCRFCRHEFEAIAK